MDEAALVVGLGNPGPKYARTRHNIGFLVADELCQRGGGGWTEKFGGLATRADVGGRRSLLLKPLTYMNLSGRSVARAAEYHRIEPEEIVVVHDDLDLPFETVRVKKGGGTGGHKGLASMVELLGSNAFSRVRIGIDRPQHGSASDYVLNNFSDDELIRLTNIIARGADAVEAIAKVGVKAAMNEYNTRKGESDDS